MQLSDFLTYVKRDFKRTDKDTEIKKAYNDMIFWVAAMMPHGNYKFQSYLNTVDAQEDYPLPSDLMHLIHPVKFLEGTGQNDSGYPLIHISKQEYDEKYPNPNRTGVQIKGKPLDYTVYSRSILVGPLPDSADYLLEIDWAKRKSELSADADTSELGAEWDEVFKQGTLERVYEGMGMLQEAQFWGNKYHRLDPKNGDDMPVGLCKRLLEAESDREIGAVGQVKFNQL
jgi:hypothetical protein